MNVQAGRLIALVAAAVLVGACATPGPEIRTDYDAEADFSRYSTFAFMPRAERPERRTYETLEDRRVIAAVTRELEARGYRRVEQDPDLLVNFALSADQVQELRQVPSARMHWHPHWYGWRGGFYHPWPYYSYETWVDRYERGTLFIDLVDAERRQLVWEGRAVSRVTRADREDPARALDNAVTEIFARYPFRAGPAR